MFWRCSEFLILGFPAVGLALIHENSIQYHTALINLFKPLLYLEAQDSTHNAINQLLGKHAKEGLAILIQYHEVYGAVYQTPIHLFCMGKFFPSRNSTTTLPHTSNPQYLNRTHSRITSPTYKYISLTLASHSAHLRRPCRPRPPQ